MPGGQQLGDDVGIDTARGCQGGRARRILGRRLGDVQAVLEPLHTGDERDAQQGEQCGQGADRDDRLAAHGVDEVLKAHQVAQTPQSTSAARKCISRAMARTTAAS